MLPAEWNFTVNRLNWRGLTFVLLLHTLLLYALWHYRILPPVRDIPPVFVQLLTDAPRPTPDAPIPNPIPPKPIPVKLAKPITPQPQEIVAQGPVEKPSDPVVPPPPLQSVSQPPMEAVVPSLPKPAGSVVLTAILAVTCPQRTAPAYPPLSRHLGETGRTVLRVELDTTGRIDHVNVKESSGFPRLDAAAIAAVGQWHCNPAIQAGEAVRAVAIQPFNFVLEGQ
jgi:protein TonB